MEKIFGLSLTLYEKIWFAVFCSIGIALPLLWSETLIGFAAFFSGIVCVLMAAKGLRMNYAAGIVNCLAYSYVSFQNGLYGEVMLNMLYYLPMQFIGFHVWNNKTGPDGIVEMRRLSPTLLLAYCAASAAVTWAYGMFLDGIEGQVTPFIDSSTNVLSVTAALLMTFRFREYWLFYILVNCISVVMWALRLYSGQTGAVAMVVMWTAYLVNSVYGLYIWYGGRRS
ncbi:MAG: nicotinamide riboside transporter PnuC [Synergistaceae bacterium]|jgi:nicotinamide mononucleotide transporter|nr:nicotinamide riboside transporter PnuC [Synergistaceae bacterium]